MQSLKKMFNNSITQAEFDKNGFVKLPLLNQEEVRTLVACYEKNREAHVASGQLHHTTTDTKNNTVILEVDQQIKTTIGKALERHMKNFDALVGCFHIKESGNGSATGIHQDPSFVDERQFSSANVWVALHDIDSTNGNLYFVKGSHKVSSALRTVPECPVYYRTYSNKLREIATELPMKAGEAVVFSNATIHGATDNQSNRHRLAATLLVCSSNAQWQIYFKDMSKKEKAIECYALNLDVFMDMQKTGKPNEMFRISEFDYVFPNISEEEFYQKAAFPLPPAKSLSWFSSFIKSFQKFENTV